MLARLQQALISSTTFRAMRASIARLMAGSVALPTALTAQQSSVARVLVTPTSPVAIIGEPLQLKAEAVDSADRPVAGVTIRWQRACCIFEGGVDPQGLVTAGAPGTLVVAVTAMVPGQRPVITRVTIPLRPGPAATITLDPAPARLLAGQSLRHQRRAVHHPDRRGSTGDSMS